VFGVQEDTGDNLRECPTEKRMNVDILDLGLSPSEVAQSLATQSGA